MFELRFKIRKYRGLTYIRTERVPVYEVGENRL